MRTATETIGDARVVKAYLTRDELLTEEIVPDELATGRAQWTYGEAQTLAETLRRLRANEPTERQRAAYEIAREELAAATADLVDVATRRRRRRIYSDDGDALDVGRYLADPERPYWSRLTRTAHAGRVVTLNVDVAANAAQHERTFARLGALAAAAVDVLAAAGIGTDVRLCDSSCEILGCMTTWIGISVPWCSPDQPLDPGALAAVGMPGLLRASLMGAEVAAVESAGLSRHRDEWTRVYGSASPWPAEVRDALYPPGEILLAARNAGAGDAARMVTVLRGLLGAEALDGAEVAA